MRRVHSLGRLVAVAVLSACGGEIGSLPGDTPDASASDAGSSHDAGGADAAVPDAAVPDAAVPDAAVPEDGGRLDAGALDAGGSKVPVIILVGKQVRRAISCDDGRTWKNDVAVDDEWPPAERYRCWQTGFVLPDGGVGSTDCDHNAYSSTSLIEAGGVFFQNLGWGTPGVVARSTDGVSWATVDESPRAPTASLMFGRGLLLASSRYGRWSSDLGRTWSNAPEMPFVAADGGGVNNARSGRFIERDDGGLFFVAAWTGERVGHLVSPDGTNWSRPTLVDGGPMDECSAGHVVEGRGNVVMTAFSYARNAWVACSSTDGARTWSLVDLAPSYPTSNTVWTGAEFRFWIGSTLWRSADGIRWSTASGTLALADGGTTGSFVVGPLTRTLSGAYVASNGGHYEAQRLLRSDDGVVWRELPLHAFERGHPITAFLAGLADRSTVCP